MKKIYTKPEIQVVEFNAEDDILTASGVPDASTGWETGGQIPFVDLDLIPLW